MSKTIRYLIVLGILIILGLGSRSYQGPFDDFCHLYIGDVLYTAMYFVIFRWVGFSPSKALVFSIVMCFSIEFLQLYQAPWIQEIREVKLGGLILGFGFLYSDLICYTIGGLLGFVVEYLWSGMKLMT